MAYTCRISGSDASTRARIASRRGVSHRCHTRASRAWNTHGAPGITHRCRTRASRAWNTHGAPGITRGCFARAGVSRVRLARRRDVEARRASARASVGMRAMDLAPRDARVTAGADVRSRAGRRGRDAGRRGQWVRSPRASAVDAEEGAKSAPGKGKDVSAMLSLGAEEEEDGLEHVYEKFRWSEVRASVRPTQVALGWDWTFYKLSNFKDLESAKSYMARKPVPYVKYRGLRYVVDHHHTLAALNLAGWDVDVYMEEIFEYDDDLAEDTFWGIMEGRGWSFCWDSNYNRLSHDAIPTTFELQAFRNDIFRSLGGFCRKDKLLKRGKMLEDKLFFEFQWGYFFWLHRNDAYGLWPSSQLQRGFDRLLTMIEQTDDSEYIGEGHIEASRDVKDMIFLSEKVLQPLYDVLVEYVAPLAYAYATLPTKEARLVSGLKKRFGRDTLPGSVITGEGRDFLTDRQTFVLPQLAESKKEKKESKDSSKESKDSKKQKD